MTPPTVQPDDPRLTAFALGELQGEERAQIESAVRADPALQAAVADIRAMAGELEEVLAGEPLGMSVEPAVDPYRRKVVRFPYYIVTGLAAACFAVIVAMQKEPPAEPGRRTFELNLATDATTAPAPASATESVASSFAMESAGTTERAMAMRVAAPMAADLGRPPTLPRRIGRPDPGFVSAVEAPQAGFVPGFDREGYARIARMIETGGRPALGDVRIEDLLNHFPYDYAEPSKDLPVAADLEVASAPWNPAHRLVRIGLRAWGEAARDGTVPAEVVARNTRVQVEFNPARVETYRLLGYESRLPVPDGTDAADLTAGQTVTALYEIVPVRTAPGADKSGNLLTLTVGYRLPQETADRHLNLALVDQDADFTKASADFRFAAAVAGFGLILQDSPYKGSATYDDVVGWAEASLAEASDRTQGVVAVERPEFARLVRLARSGNNG